MAANANNQQVGDFEEGFQGVDESLGRYCKCCCCPNGCYDGRAGCYSFNRYNQDQHLLRLEGTSYAYWLKFDTAHVNRIFCVLWTFSVIE